jgi:hypothetical protein
MSKLELINISNCNLVNAPNGWGYVPNTNLKIILINNRIMNTFPYSVCANDYLKEILLDGSNVSRTIDWSYQIYRYWHNSSNNSSTSPSSIFEPIPVYINKPCSLELYNKLEHLSLANNQLSCPFKRYDDIVSTSLQSPMGAAGRKIQSCSIYQLSKFLTLKTINLDNNRFQILGNIIVSELSHVLENNLLSLQTTTTVAPVTARSIRSPVSLANNDIRSIALISQETEISDFFLNINIDWKNVNSIDLGPSGLGIKILGNKQLPFNLHKSEMTNLYSFRCQGNDLPELRGIFNHRVSLKLLALSTVELKTLHNELLGLYNIEELHIIKNKLTFQSINNSFIDTMNLEILDLQQNNIERITRSTFQNLLKLKTLVLRWNQLKFLNMSHIPMNVTTLLCTDNYIQDFVNTHLHDSIQYLRLSNNLLQYLNISYTQTLESMIASNNKHLHSIDARNLPMLEYVDVSYCNFTTIHSKMFQASFKLKRLIMKHNFIRTIDKGIFYNMKELNYIDLSHNSIRCIDVQLFQQMKINAMIGSTLIYKFHGNQMNQTCKNAIIRYFKMNHGFIDYNKDSNIFVGYRDSSSNQLYVESKLQPIKNIGDYNQYDLRSPTMCSPANQCLKCQGDCDLDIDCVGNLLCKETESPRDVIPGCKDSNNNSGGTFGMRQSRRGGTSDYCYDVSITFVFKLPSVV